MAKRTHLRHTDWDARYLFGSAHAHPAARDPDKAAGDHIAEEMRRTAFVVDQEAKNFLAAIIDVVAIETGNRAAREHWQYKQLQNLLQFVAQKSVFWRERIGTRKITDVSPSDLPVLTRSDVAKQVESEGSLLPANVLDRLLCRCQRGLQLGRARGNVNTPDINSLGGGGLGLPTSFPISLNPNGFIGGGQIGCNWQLNNAGSSALRRISRVLPKEPAVLL